VSKVCLPSINQKFINEFEARMDNPRPREVPFLFVTFSLGKQRESKSKTQKKLKRPIEASNLG